jgi:hypothetical protein
MPSKGSSGTKKKQSTAGSDTSSSITIKTEKAQADSTTSSDGHPIHGDDKKWATGDRVLCRYMNAENIYYEAKIMSLKEKGGESAYAIHYPVNYSI